MQLLKKQKGWIKKTLGISLVCIGLAQCSGNSATITENQNESAVQDQGYSMLANGNFEEAAESYCNYLTELGITETEDGRIEFGCFLSRYFLILESVNTDNLLAQFGQDPFSLNTVFSESGMLAAIDSNPDLFIQRNRFPFFNYSDFNLPFNNVFNPIMERYPTDDTEQINAMIDELVRLAIEQGSTHNSVLANLDEYIGMFRDLETRIQPILDNPDFVFELPSTLFYTSRNLFVNVHEVRLMAAAIKAKIVGLSIIQAYDYGVNFEIIHTEDDELLDLEVVAAELNGENAEVNGVRVDGQAFLTLVHPERIRDQQERSIEALQLAIEGFEGQLDESSFDLYPSGVSASDITKALEISINLLTSMEGFTSIHETIEGGTLHINLGAFFSNPPDASLMPAEAGYPFVADTYVVRQIDPETGMEEMVRKKRLFMIKSYFKTLAQDFLRNEY